VLEYAGNLAGRVADHVRHTVPAGDEKTGRSRPVPNPAHWTGMID
jgi:hypothetical protein